MEKKKEKKMGKIILIDKDTGEILLEGIIEFDKITTEKGEWIFYDRKYRIEVITEDIIEK